MEQREEDVGHLNEGIRSFEVRRPKLEEGCLEVSIREGAEELTLRAEEVGSQKACIKCWSHCEGQVRAALGRR